MPNLVLDYSQTKVVYDLEYKVSYGFNRLIDQQELQDDILYIF